MSITTESLEKEKREKEKGAMSFNLLKIFILWKCCIQYMENVSSCLKSTRSKLGKKLIELK